MTSDPAAMGRVTSGDCTLLFKAEGTATAPALVLLHMLGGDMSLWDGLVPALSDAFRVIRPDSRGHGGSTLGSAPVTIRRLGEDVLAILDELGIERVHVCGLSMGGLVAQWLLAHAGHRIDRAVIAGSAGRMGDVVTWNARIASALSDGMAPAVAPALERWFSPAFVAREPRRVAAVGDVLRDTSPAAYAACCAAIRDADLREAVRGAETPVLLVRGRDDPAAPAESAMRMAAALGDAEIVELEARHCSCVEAEAAFAAALRTFLLTNRDGPRRNRTGGGRAAAEAGRAKSASRRGTAAARTAVAKQPPASRKAAAKASATRKNAARTVPRPIEPPAARRRGTKVAATPAKRTDSAPARPRDPAGEAAGRAHPALDPDPVGVEGGTVQGGTVPPDEGCDPPGKGSHKP